MKQKLIAGNARSHFRPLLVEPNVLSGASDLLLERTLLSENQLLLSERESAAAAVAERRARGTFSAERSARMMRTARDRQMAMTYAILMNKKRTNFKRALAQVSKEWDVSESVVEAACDRWLDLARQAIAEYLSSSQLEEQEVLDQLLWSANVTRAAVTETLLRRKQKPRRVVKGDAHCKLR